MNESVQDVVDEMRSQINEACKNRFIGEVSEDTITTIKKAIEREFNVSDVQGELKGDVFIMTSCVPNVPISHITFEVVPELLAIYTGLYDTDNESIGDAKCKTNK